MLLIGTGPMAVDYTKVLTDIGVDFVVVGRGNDSAARFKEQTGIQPITGGVEAYLNNGTPDADGAVIATGTETLMPIMKLLVAAGINHLLVEKPAAISVDELQQNKDFIAANGASIFVAYNRRFYESVKVAKELIAADGGLRSMNFEFTEWAHKIEPLAKAPGVKENWFLANSTHVVDTAFHIAGRPKEFCAFTDEGTLQWHDNSNFSGAGITVKDVLFAYHANWESAGRWSLEFLTAKRKIILCPLEKVQIQQRGSIAVEQYPINDSLDIQYKPGLYLQTKAFVDQKTSLLLSLDEHLINAETIYAKMAGTKTKNSLA